MTQKEDTKPSRKPPILLDKTEKYPCPFCGSRKARIIAKGRYTQLSKTKKCFDCFATWKLRCSKFSALLFLVASVLVIIGFSVPYIEWLNFKNDNVPWLRGWPNDDRGASCLPNVLIFGIGIGIWVLILSLRELLGKKRDG